MSDQRKHPAQSNGDTPEGWPRGVRPISVDGLDHIGVGGDGSLYWDGKPIVVQRELTLRFWQRAGVVLVTGSAVVAAGAAVVSAWSDVACAL